MVSALVMLALATAPTCAPILAQSHALAKRDIVADDLLRLRDFGSGDDRSSPPSPLALSPDGKLIALQLRQADPVANRYCLAMVVLPIAGDTPPWVIDVGDELARDPGHLRNLVLGSGNPLVVTPAWSPNGRWVAYRRSVSDVLQLWAAAADGTGSRALTHGPDNVETFGWRADSAGLVFTVRPSVARERAAIAHEGRDGFLFDRRTWALATTQPAPGSSGVVATEAVLLDGSATRAATPAERAILEPPRDAPTGAIMVAGAAPPDRVAWVEQERPGLMVPLRVRVRIDGNDIACPEPACGDGVTGLWWLGNSLAILRNERPARRGVMELYRLDFGRARPRKLLSTQALLTGCRLATPRLICARESSLRPRHLVAIALSDGRIAELFDPNPAFRTLRLGSARRLVWRDRFGTEAFGDLVLPPPPAVIAALMSGVNGAAFRPVDLPCSRVPAASMHTNSSM